MSRCSGPARSWAPLLFAAFSMLWTPLTFLLSSPPYSYNTTTIGLFWPAAGAFAANRFGRLADRGLANLATRVGLLLLLGSWGLMAFGQASVLALLAGILLQDLAIQGCMSPIPAASIRCGRKQPPDDRLHDQLFHWRRVRLAGIVLALFAFRLDRRGGRRGALGVITLAYGTLSPARACRKPPCPLSAPSTSYNQGF